MRIVWGYEAEQFAAAQAINREAARLAESLAALPPDPYPYEEEALAMHAMWAEDLKVRRRHQRADGLDFSERQERRLMEMWLADAGDLALVA